MLRSPPPPPRLVPPPRSLPLSLVLANRFNGGVRVGMCVFGFGMIFFWAFVVNGDYSLFTWRGAVARTEGTVLEVRETSVSVDQSRVLAFRYRYAAGTRLYESVSYSTDQNVHPGEKVPVDYLAASPERARISGMRPQMIGPAVSLLTILPLIGLLIAVSSMASGGVRNDLLRKGIVATEQHHGTSAARERVEALARRIDASDDQMEQMESQLSDLELTTNPLRFTLFDPQRPERTQTFDRTLAGDDGELRGRPAGALAGIVLTLLITGASILPLLNRAGIDWLGALKSLITSTFSSKTEQAR